ncbi:MAG: transglutaminase family protein [Syntrophotaleaceae bacterium]
MLRKADAPVTGYPWTFDEQPPADQQSGNAPISIPHTALCVEARDGRLHVFMALPKKLEHYLDLIARRSRRPPPNCPCRWLSALRAASA